MGSTGEIDTLYMLLATLGELRKWIQTTFHNFLQEWFDKYLGTGE